MGLDTDIGARLTLKTLLLFLLATPVQFWIGARFYVGMYNSLKSRYANMDTLIAGGTSVAYGYSVISVCSMGSLIAAPILLHLNWSFYAPQVILQMTNPTFEGHDYFETSALLIMFVVLGKYLESMAKGRTSDTLYQVNARLMRRLFAHSRLPFFFS